MKLNVVKGKISTKMKVGIFIAAIMAIYWFFGIGTSSKEAFINARVAPVLSPIPGNILFNSEVFPGLLLSANQEIAVIESNETNAQITQLIIQRQTLEHQVTGLIKQIDGNQVRLSLYMQQQRQYQGESKQQRALENSHFDAGQEQLKNEIISLSKQAGFAEKKLKQFRVLFLKGHVSKVEFDRLTSEAGMLRAAEKAKSAELKQLMIDMNAAASGLQLSGPRTLDAPQQNARDLTLTIEDIKQIQSTLKAELGTMEKKLKEINQLLSAQQTVTVRSPLHGVIWELDAPDHAGLVSGSPILQIADCNQRWVEAFFDESEADKLYPGRKVVVRLSVPSSGRLRSEWRGEIKSVRAGSGRVSVGENVVMPPPEIARRQLPVKVVTARIAVEWKDKPDPSLFCMIGRSVTVSVL